MEANSKSYLLNEDFEANLTIWPSIGSHSSIEVLFEIVQLEALLNVEKFSAFLKIPGPQHGLAHFRFLLCVRENIFRI